MKMKALSKNILILIVLTLIVTAGVAILMLNPSGEKIIQISGAGSTFVNPFLSKAAFEYAKISNVQVNYQSIGSGAGIRQFLEKTIDFGATDAPLSSDKYVQAKDPLHIPVIIGSVVVIYNIPEYKENGLKFTGEILADIFLGKIKKWNDKRLVELNSFLININKEITVIHRSEGSGTTYVWTNYLTKISSEWAKRVGMGTSVSWPIGIGGKGNEGVANLVKQIPYSIGYVEFTYAIQNNLNFGAIKNSAGEFILPSIESMKKTVEYIAISLPKGDEDWSKISIIDIIINKNDAYGSYPLSSFVYILIYKELSKVPKMTKEKALALVQFLKWLITEAQKFAEDLYYVPLSKEVIQLNLQTLSMVTFNNEKLIG